VLCPDGGGALAGRHGRARRRQHEMAVVHHSLDGRELREQADGMIYRLPSCCWWGSLSRTGRIVVASAAGASCGLDPPCCGVAGPRQPQGKRCHSFTSRKMIRSTLSELTRDAGFYARASHVCAPLRYYDSGWFSFSLSGSGSLEVPEFTHGSSICNRSFAVSPWSFGP
jgi:hypothetical protein